MPSSTRWAAARRNARVRKVTVTRYVTPLREGGSLPAIVEADDRGLYVLKFRGAGQGPKALAAEIIAGDLARAAGLKVPEIVLAHVDAELARSEPDPEIQELIRASAGINVALDYLPGSVMFDPVADRVDGLLASSIVWFDALVTNIDRTARNTNLLMWHGSLWLIDHGAALYFHHAGGDFVKRAREGFPQVKDHVLLHSADALEEADTILGARLTEAAVRDVVAEVPTEWIGDPAGYTDYFAARLRSPRAFLEEALRARSR